jgi:UDP-GlcNAc:undecaprenyl-phosphate GlcNAc-1-phosphate transferase
MTANLVIPAIFVALIVAISFMLALRPLALRVGLVDKPGGRKRHKGHIPMIGGIAIFAGLFAGVTLIETDPGAYLTAFVACALLLVIGVIDDSLALPASARMTAQVGAVLIMIYGLGHQLSDIGDPFGTGLISTGQFTLVFTLLVALTMINAYNLVDGLDGLAGSLALIALLSVALVAGISNKFGGGALVAAAAVVGFLMFNFPAVWNRPVRAFLGDAGSTMLGFVIVWLTLGIAQGDERAISPVACLWFAAIPIFDCLTCFVRRALKGKSPFSPGRDHFHHALTRGGFSVRQILGILVGLQIIYALVGLAGNYYGVQDYILFSTWSVLGLSQRWVIRRIARSHRLYRWRQTLPLKLVGEKATART